MSTSQLLVVAVRAKSPHKGFKEFVKGVVNQRGEGAIKRSTSGSVRFNGKYQVYYVGNEKELFSEPGRRLQVDLGPNLAVLFIADSQSYPREIHNHIATYFQAVKGTLGNYEMEGGLKRWV